MEGCCSNVGKIFKLLGLAACITVVSTAGMAQSVKNVGPSQKGQPVLKGADQGKSLPRNSAQPSGGLVKPQKQGSKEAVHAVKPVGKGSPFSKGANPAMGTGKFLYGAPVERGGGDGADACGSASPIAGAGSFAFSNVGATTDGPDHPVACLSFGSGQVFNDVWFLWTSVAGGTATFSVCNASYDTRMNAYPGAAACPPAEADLIVCNDDFCGTDGFRSQISFAATAGQTYKIRIGSYSATAFGSGNLVVTEAGGGGGGGGGNDNCADATAIGDGSFAFDTTGATTDGPEEPTLCFGFGDGNVGCDLWWDYTASCDGIGTASLCGASYDSKIAAYNGSTCPTAESAMVCDDDFCAFAGPSQISFAVSSGSHYLIRVGGYNCATGSGTLTTSCLGGGAPGNDTCDAAQQIDCGGTASSNNTFATTSGDDPMFACSFGGPQQGFGTIWYRFQATGNAATASLCNSSATDTMIQILDGSCGNFVALSCNDDACGGNGLLSSTTATGLTPGNFYYIEVGSFNTAGQGGIELSLTCQNIAPCDGTAEGEPNCGLDGEGTNGGCNSATPAFQAIDCGQTYCASAGADGNFRDTDWYAVEFAGGTQMTWTVNANFPVLVGIVDNGGVPSCAGVSAFLVSATGAEFTDTTVTACVPAGTWWPFVAPNTFSGVACETGYTATLTCEPCEATTPANDLCTGAIALSVPADVLGSTAFSTFDAGLPACGTDITVAGVWYTVVGDGSTYTASLCNGGTSYDTKIHAFCGSCATGQFVCVAGDDDACGYPPGYSQIAFCTNVGQTYYILVHGYSGTGDFELTVSSDGSNCGGGADCSTSGPGNDLCGDAITIACGSTVEGNNAFATTDGTDPNFDCSFGGPQQGFGSVWYRFQATGNAATVDLCGSSAADTMIQILDGGCGSFTALACNDDFCGGNGLLSSATASGLTAGNFYYIEIAGFDAAGAGPYVLNLSCFDVTPCVGTPEGEPNCGLDGEGTNGGCNSATPAFQPIVCGQTYCASGGADGNFRDTDWYEVTFGGGTQMTWTVNAAFPVLVGIVDNGGVPSCAGVSAFLVSATGGAFENVTVTACVPAGTWWPFVAPNTFSGVACETGYTATLTCEPCNASGPPNDTCATAIALSVPADVFGTTAFATADPGLPDCGVTITVAGVWYTVVGDGSTLTASLCNGGTVYDTKIHVFCGNCATGQFICIAGDDDACGYPPGYSQAAWCTNAAQTYYILVHGYSGTGDFELTVSSDGSNCGGGLDCSGGAPANDTCEGAQLVACGSVTTGSNQFATVDGNDPNFDCAFAGPQQGFGTIWYRFQATQGEATAAVCNSGASDTMIQILDGSCGNLVSLGCNDDFCGANGLRSSVTVSGLTVGNFYYIEVASWEAAGQGQIELTLDCNEPCVVECPSGAMAEPEPCDNDIYSGCNSVPPAFIPIACGQTVCGTAWNTTALRDTDWYALNIVAPNTRNATWTVTAEFNVLIGIVENGGIPNCAGVSAFRVATTGGPCQPVSVNSSLPAGTWWFFVSASTFDGSVIPCGANGDYVAHLDCGIAEPCNGDANGDGVVGLADIARVIACWGQPAACNPAADVDGNGSIGLGDVARIVKNWGCGY